ncbi:MAG: T9SS type B sorting domain-containing protein, partial [Sphingobacteriales bacterium]
TLNGASANNYSVSNTSASTTGSITPKAITATANATPLISKAYNGNTNATIVAGNISLTGLVGADQVVASGTASYASSSAGNKAVAINGIILEGSARNNYQLSNTTAATNGTITQKTVTITADNKTKVQNLPNPPLTASYTGFINGESNSVLTTQPTLTTTATTTSVQGTYSIIASGAIATNYSFTYVPGTLTVSPGAPSTVSLANVTLYENQAPGTNAGTLNSTSDDPNATFTYALVNGSGDTDNALFAIAGNQLNTSASLNYENKPSYSVRVRSTSQYGLSLDQVFNVAINDVNEAPTIASIPNQTTCFTTAQQTFTITGISAGPETSQNVTLSFTNNNADLFSQIAITNAGVFTYTVKPGQSGTATILVTAQDNGGVANGGIDVATKAFIISVNALPVMSVTVDGGTDVSKGATTTITATGGVGYTWANATGIISGQNAAALTVRPLITTTYTVTVSNSSGCTTTQSITLNVMEDFKALEATNVMSPNSDGTNDVFVIKNIEVYPNNDLKVFDRAGRIVFSAKGYKNTWDATINGSPLTEGTYYYVVDFGDGKMKKKGYITIIRN